MRVVWSQTGEVCVRDVHTALPETMRGAYTTVKTTMERLANKGILSRTRKGKAYLYRATISQEELERRIVMAILNGLVEQFPKAVASLWTQFYLWTQLHQNVF